MLILHEKLAPDCRNETIQLDDGITNINRKEIRLNLGCGSEDLKLYINGDIKKDKGVEILVDLDSPLPFKSNSCDEVRLAGVIAHVKHPLKLRAEVDRILKDGGTAMISSCSCHSGHRHNIGGVYLKNTPKPSRRFSWNFPQCIEQKVV